MVEGIKPARDDEIKQTQQPVALDFNSKRNVIAACYIKAAQDAFVRLVKGIDEAGGESYKRPTILFREELETIDAAYAIAMAIILEQTPPSYKAQTPPKPTFDPTPRRNDPNPDFVK